MDRRGGGRGEVLEIKTVPHYMSGADFNNPKDIDMIDSHKDPMLPMGIFWEWFKEELANEWMDLAREVYSTLGYDEKTVKEKVNVIKYNYAVQGREECLYQLFRAWQGEAKFWLFNLRVVIRYLLKNNRHNTVQLIFDHPHMHFYTKWIDLDELSASVGTTAKPSRFPSASKLGKVACSSSAQPLRVPEIGVGEQDKRIGVELDSSGSVSKSRVSSMETQNIPQIE